MTDRSHPLDTPTPSPYAAGPTSPDVVPVGPVTRANAAKVLEQSLGAVWAGILESHGHKLGEQWDLVIGELHLERHRSGSGEGPGDAAVAGVAAPANGALAQ